MHIEFDAAKNDSNIATRGLSFERVAEFDFGTAGIDQDTRKAYPEARFVAVGFWTSACMCCASPPRLAAFVSSAFARQTPER
jgi:uncharacterized DUF497 family protein